MPQFSYITTDFRGGVWSRTSQGRITDDRYKTALNVGGNATATEQGAWQRRPGLRLITATRHGSTAQLRAFRFSREQAYQMEFTDLKARFIVGLDLVRDVSATPTVTGISSATPAIVTLGSMPGSWVAGNTVIFNVNTASTTEQVTTYALFGRPFRIGTIVGNTFQLLDAETGANINGSVINFLPRTNLDTVQRVLEVTTPYVEADLPYIRLVNTSDEVIVLCRPPNSLGYPPYVLRESGVSQFTFTKAVFVDGPFLDQPFDLIKNFINDLTLSGVTGSVTVTADSTTSINDNTGFQTTDVGRQIWLQTGPPSWSGATTYAKEFKVLGSDNNIYKSVAGGNLNHDPTTDTGTYWEITSDTVVCTYGTITARTSTTVVTMTIEGDDAKSTAPTRHWRLGVYSDTTGYPSCGCIHEDRLILAGALENRFDGSRNFRHLTFSPTEVDGTVSDDNAVAAVLSNKDAELISWMVSGDDGMFIGSLAGEWKISASNLDDPITPTSIQARNITAVGSANIEPVDIYGAPYAVQAASRKLVAHHKNYQGGYDPINLSERAEGLMNPSITDLAWVQEPLSSFFVLRADGTLVSCVHKKAINQEEYTGWFVHEHAAGRIFETVSSGPNFSGTSDSLYVTSWDEDAAHPRWIETMMPVFTTGSPVWAAWHTDASSSGYYVRRMITANGDSFNGIRVYVSWYLNGMTVHPYIGGIDVGDFVVTNGYVDVPYSTKFTYEFLASLNDGTDYAEWGVHLTWANIPGGGLPAGVIANTIAVLRDPDSPFLPGQRVLYDLGAEEYGHIFRFYANSGNVNDRNIEVFRADTGVRLQAVSTREAIFNLAPGDKDLRVGESFGDTTDMVAPDKQLPSGGFFGLTDYTAYNNSAVSLFSRTTLKEFWFSGLGLGLNIPVQTLCCRWVHATAPANWSASITYAATNQVFGPDKKVYASIAGGNLNHNPAAVGSTFWSPVTMPALVNNFAVMAQQGGGSGDNVMTVMNLTPTPLGNWTKAMGEIIASNTASGYPARFFYRGIESAGSTTFFEVRWNNNLLHSATDITLLKWTMTASVGVPALASATIRSFNPASDFSPSFASGSRNFYVMVDLVDGHPIILTTEYPSGQTRIVKVHSTTGVTQWDVPAPEMVPESFMPPKGQPGLTIQRWHYMSNTGKVYSLNTSTGAMTQVTNITSGFSSFGGKIVYDEAGPSLMFSSVFNSVAGETYVGPWAIADQPSWGTQKNRLWLGTGASAGADNRALSGDLWFIPMNIGISFSSTGQLLRPDYGIDGGQRAGPAFGKKRRNHWYAMSIDNGFNIEVGVNFTNMYPVKLQSAGGVALAAPSLYSGTMSDTLNDDYSWDGMIAWRIKRQYPGTITSVGGFISTQDK